MNTVTAVIETPKGNPEKYKYDPKTKFFKLKKILPTGMVFPYDFGFIPHTKGEDGDPLDIIVISEFKSFPGCMVECKIVGAIAAKQTEKNKTIRNDRFLAIPVYAKSFSNIESVEELPEKMLEELEKFFITYNEIEGKTFKPIERLKAKDAFKLINKNKDE
jgi:inorganic pyrophosphatase